MPSAYGPLTLGELIDALKATLSNEVPEYVQSAANRQIYFDWCEMRPGGFHSYRGYYDHLCVSILSDGEETVERFIARCTAEIGETHHGWKGGEYTMGERTPVWVAAKPRSASGFGVSGVRDDGHAVTITTAEFR